MIKLPTKPIKFLIYFLSKQPLAFTLISLSHLSLILEKNIIPYSLKLMVDSIEQINSKIPLLQKLLPGLFLFLGSWLILIIIDRIQQWWQSYVIPRFEEDIRMHVVSYVLEYPYKYFITKFSGNIANKINDLPRSINTIRIIIFWDIIPTLIINLIALIMMYKINKIFSLILGLWILVHLTLTKYFIKNVNQASYINSNDKSILSGSIVDTIANILSMKLMSNKSYEIDYIIKIQTQEKNSNKSMIQTINIFLLWIDITTTIMLVSFIYFLLTSLNEEKINLGDFVFILSLVIGIISKMHYLSKVSAELFQEIGRSEESLSLITDITENQTGSYNKSFCISTARIEFKNVTFSYDNQNYIFRNKSVIIKPGEKVALVGFSGAGKTTFVNLLLGLFEPDSGVIKIDGQDISKISKHSLRKLITLVPQDTHLFHRTILENIRYGNINATDEDIIEASKKAYCHEFISNLPNGYNSMVGERGVKLSGGQRQRIAIARAFLRNTPILILDEATSSLDYITEKMIQKTLQDLMQNKTVIIIAHRLSTLMNMDRILVFEHGKIIEEGSHEELIKLDRVYAYMYKKQSYN